MKNHGLLCAGLALSALLTAIACTPVAPPAPGHVDLFDSYFSPESLSVAKGATVTWVNHGSVNHTSTSGSDSVIDGHWRSPDLAPGDSFSHTFDTTGAYPYHCEHHWMYGMRGRIIVTP